MSKTNKVGEFSQQIINTLNLQNVSSGTPILLGATNISHMQSSHPTCYKQYGSQISIILSSPDYVGINSTDGSIEFIKDFFTDGKFVKVAVRISGNGHFFAHSMYVVKNNRVNNFITKGTLKKV